MANKIRNVEQERIRKLIYINLDKLFQEIDKIEKEVRLEEKKGVGE